MIKALLLDADGVSILSPHPFSYHLEHEHGISRDATIKFFSGPFQNCLVGKADLKEELSPYTSLWGWNHNIDDLLQFWFKSEHHVNKPLLKEVQSLREAGIKAYLATNNEKYRTEYMRDQMGFSHAFDGIYSSAYLGEKKPAPAFFHAIINDLNINPPEISFWDDSEENVAAARITGIKSALYKSVEDFKKEIAS